MGQTDLPTSLAGDGCQIITMNAAAPVAEAMLVGEGRIAWVGLLEDAPAAGRGVEIIRGRWCRASEPHMHLPPLAMMHEFSKSDLIASRPPKPPKGLPRCGGNPQGRMGVGRQFDPHRRGRIILPDRWMRQPSTLFVYNASLHLATVIPWPWERADARRLIRKC